jgi:hypothetical protein
VPPPASKRALPTPTKTAGGLSRVYERAKPATTATLITTMNGANPPSHAQLERRSTDDVVAVVLLLRYAARAIPRDVLLAAWPAEPRLLERLLPTVG